MFDQQYRHLAAWILDGDGWIELGQDDFSRSLVRILDIGGMITVQPPVTEMVIRENREAWHEARY